MIIKRNLPVLKQYVPLYQSPTSEQTPWSTCECEKVFGWVLPEKERWIWWLARLLLRAIGGRSCAKQPSSVNSSITFNAKNLQNSYSRSYRLGIFLTGFMLLFLMQGSRVGSSCSGQPRHKQPAVSHTTFIFFLAGSSFLAGTLEIA
uniref:Uncharacterized protein n=1 Tax=Sphaerodactylus townsendi TaxID=933632 RepID=A0ACB8ELD9_9SAUR